MAAVERARGREGGESDSDAHEEEEEEDAKAEDDEDDRNNGDDDEEKMDTAVGDDACYDPDDIVAVLRGAELRTKLKELSERATVTDADLSGARRTRLAEEAILRARLRTAFDAL